LKCGRFILLGARKPPQSLEFIPVVLLEGWEEDELLNLIFLNSHPHPSHHHSVISSALFIGYKETSLSGVAFNKCFEEFLLLSQFGP
jgi:hypothetical protein